jgi:1-acyl-sn-glycerol-3-phosphate acyltransferase
MDILDKNKLIEPHNVFKIKWTPLLILRSIILVGLRLPFILLLLLLIFVYTILPINRSIFIDKLICKSLCFFFGIIIKLENYKKENTFPKIIVCNHLSVLDAIIIPAVLPCKFGFVFNHIAAYTFPFSSGFKKFGGIILNKRMYFRDKNNSDKIEEITNYLNLNEPKNEGRLFIFPEGRHTNGKYMIDFRRGAFMHDVDIQPIIISTDNMFLDEKDVYSGVPEYGMKIISNKNDYYYLLMYLFRIIINPYIIGLKYKFLNI